MKRVKKSGRVEAIYKRVGANVKRIRDLNRWSQAKLGSHLKPKYTRSAISALEKGARRAPLHVYYGIAEAFGIPADSVLP